MKWPVVFGGSMHLSIFIQGDFERIGTVHESASLLDCNVRADGRADFVWLMDADGCHYALTSLGLLSRTLAQRLRLSRRVERFQLGPPQRLRVAAFRLLLKSLTDRFEEAPDVTLLREALGALPADHEWSSADMRAFLGV